MVEATLLLGNAMTVAEGLGYLAVAWLLRARRIAPDLRFAATLFAWWWVGAGANKLLAGVVGFGAVAGVVGLDLYIAVLYLNLVVLALSLWCLLAYFSFLFAGTTRWFGTLAVVEAGFFLLLTYNLIASQPTAIGFGAWRTFHVPSVPSPPVRQLAVLFLLVVPQVVAALAHLALFRRVTEPVQRWRVAFVSFAILAWTASVFLLTLPAFATSASMQVASRLIGALGALAGLWAYRPPALFARRLSPGRVGA